MDRRRLLAALALAWTVVWVQRAALSPAGPLVQEELGLGYAGLGLLSTVSVLGGAAGYLSAAFLAPRHPRATLVAGLALLGLATVAGRYAASDVALAATQVLAGFGEGLFFVPALALVTQTHPPERLGRALGTLDSGISIGVFLVLLAGGALLPSLGWRGLFLVAGGLGLLLVLPAAAATRGAATSARAQVRDVLPRRAWPLYAAVSLLNLVYFALIYLSPTVLVARGLDLGTADLVVAAAVGLGIPWHFLGGKLADQGGAARMAAKFITAVALAIAAMAIEGSPIVTSIALIVAYSLGIAGTVSLLALVPRMLGTDLAAPGFGVFWGLGYLGGAAGPLLMGFVAEAWGFQWALLMLGIAAGLAAILIAPLKPQRPQGPSTIPLPLTLPPPEPKVAP